MESEAMRLARAFDQKHGESLSDGTTRYYRDGSTRENDRMGLLSGVECYDLANPEHEFLIAWNKRTFAQLKLEKATEDFDEYQHALGSTASAGNAELAELKRLQGIVKNLQTLVDRAEQALANTAKGKQQRRVEQARAEEQAKLVEFQRQRRLIRI